MDPFTIAAGIGSVGSLFQGITGLFSGWAANHEAKLQADQDRAEAGLAAGQQLQQGDQVAARAATQAAANGGGFVGSSLGVISSLASQAMFNARAKVYQGLTQARSDLYQGKVAAQNGRNQFIGSAVQAGSTLLSGFAQSASQAKMMQALQNGGAGGFDGGGADAAAFS